MPDTPHVADLTLEELRARIAAAGVTIADERLPMVRKLLDDALAPLRKVDSRAIRPLEPAVTFNAAGPHVGAIDE
jgi:hypothetical protein